MVRINLSSFINFYNLRRWSHSKEFNYGKTIFCNSLFLKKLKQKDLKKARAKRMKNVVGMHYSLPDI